MSQKFGSRISTDTIRRTIKTKLSFLVVQEEEKLTPKQKKQRVLFATNRADYDWKFALFTDEKTWQLGSGVKSVGKTLGNA